MFRIVYELLRLLASAWAQAEDLKSRTAELHKRAQAGEELDTKAWKAALDAKCRGLKSVVLGLQGSIREISRKVGALGTLSS